MDISSVDALHLSLIDQYVEGDPNPEFENSMMETLWHEQKYGIILYALEKGFILTYDIEKSILKSGNLSLYQYLDRKGKLVFNPQLIIDLLQFEIPICMDTLKWLYSKGCGWVNDHNLYIAENLELLKWLYENGCPLDPIVCVSYAALMCNTKSLKWLHAKNFSFDAWTYRWVVKTKELQSCGIQPPSIDSQIATLDCLKDLGCPYLKEVLLLEAPLHERIIMWMKEYK